MDLTVLPATDRRGACSAGEVVGRLSIVMLPGPLGRCSLARHGVLHPGELDFAGGCPWPPGKEHDGARHLVSGQAATDRVLNFVVRQRAVAGGHHGRDSLSRCLVRDTDDDRVGHVGVGQQDLLDLLEMDLLAACVDDARSLGPLRGR